MSDVANQFSEAELRAALREKNKAKEESKRAYKALVNENLPVIVGKLINLSEYISEVKTEVFKDFKDLLQIKEETFGVKERQQSHSFSLDTGETIKIGVRVSDGWDDTVSAGEAMIVRYLDSLIKDDDTAFLVKTINGYLKKDDKGNLKSGRVLELSKIADERGDAEFIEGVDIVKKAYRPQKSCHFIDAYTTDELGKKKGIGLSISSVDFIEPLDFKVSELE